MLKSDRKTVLSGLVVVSFLLSGCNGTGDGFSSFGSSAAELKLPDTVEFFPDSEVLGVAKAQFAAGNFGNAARYYERAVEVAPNNSEAWLGLAASYDRVRRFELADRAYREAGRHIGHRAEYYNNIGYSYLLRGNAMKARDNFLRAREIDPANPTINNNLEMLRDNITAARNG